MEAQWYIAKYVNTPSVASSGKDHTPLLPHVSIIDPATGEMIQCLLRAGRVPTLDMVLDKCRCAMPYPLGFMLCAYSILVQDFLADSPSPSDYWKTKHQRLQLGYTQERGKTISNSSSSGSGKQSSCDVCPGRVLATVEAAESNISEDCNSDSTKALGFSSVEVCTEGNNMFKSPYPLCLQITAAATTRKCPPAAELVDTTPAQKPVVAMVRVMLPGGTHIIEKFSGEEECTVGKLLSRIIAKVCTDWRVRSVSSDIVEQMSIQFSEEDKLKRFEVFFGFPIRALSKLSPLEALTDTSLAAANLVNEKVTVRFI